VGIVLDCSSLIPCGRRSKREEEAIRELGNKLYRAGCVTIYLSNRILQVYNSRLVPELNKCHPLPEFQANLTRILPWLLKTVHGSRGFMCNLKPTKEGIKFHILESSRVSKYDVNGVGPLNEEDKEFLKVALTSTSYHNKVFLVTLDTHFLHQLDIEELKRRYIDEMQKISIVSPSNQRLLNTIDLLNKKHNGLEAKYCKRLVKNE
jgi:hypothetical protein